MTRRFLVLSKLGDDSREYFMEVDFTNSSRDKAVDAFRTLYGEQDGFLLVEQVAVSEPAGSCDEADDSSREDSVQQSRHVYTGGTCNDLDDSY